MELSQLAELIRTDWVPVTVSEDVKKETDEFLVDIYWKELPDEHDLNGMFPDSPESTYPAEEFVYDHS